MSLLTLVSSVASAQAIGGTVRDASGAVLPGVTVEARSDALIEQVRSVTTDGAGRFLVVSLRPGTYLVTFSLPGFATVVREGIELTTGFTANVDVELDVGSVSESVTVTGASPVVDVQNVAERVVMTRDVIELIPTGRNFQNLGILVPGMTGDGAVGFAVGQDVGGLSAQSYLRLAIHGGKGTDQAVHIDGLSAETLIREDTTDLVVSEGNFQEFALEYSGHNPEVETGGVRVNFIPREGGNTYHGGFFASFSRPSLQANNVDEDLLSRGLGEPNRLIKLWRFNPTFGGPIKRDKVWFYVSHTQHKTETSVGALFYEQDPAAFVYSPDLSRQAIDNQYAKDNAIRLTWQATSRNKFGFFFENSPTDFDYNGIGSPVGRPQRTMPSAAAFGNMDENIYQLTYSSPITNRVLVEAGASKMIDRWQPRPTREAVLTLPQVFDLATNTIHRNQAAGRGHFVGHNWTTRGSVSYATGTHAVKIGFTTQYGWLRGVSVSTANNMQLRSINSQPAQVQYYGNPAPTQNHVGPNLGIYAQDQWRIERVTVNGGVRFDYFRNSYPDHFISPTQWVPVVRDFPGRTAVIWKDLQPRLGVVYDPAGDGKTAVKASLGRYGRKAGVQFASAINPASSNNTVIRTWTDLNGDRLPQGDPTNHEPNGELGLSTNRAFGRPVITTFYDPEWAFGWGKRFSNWEFSTSVDRELAPSVAATIGYFRRAYVNFSTVDNLARSAGDFEEFSVTAPLDPRLPGRGGYVVRGLVDARPAVAGLTDNITTSSNNFGGESEVWNGVDLGVTARRGAWLLQGGVSTGRTATDRCTLALQLPEALGNTPRDFCATTTPFLTQIKLFGSYRLPYGLQLAGTLQNTPGPERQLQVVYTNVQIAPSLGRPLSDRNSVVINVLRPGTAYGERLNQLDLRLAKIFRLRSSGRLNAALDVYNALNNNTVLAESAQLTNWLQPFSTLPGRLVKFSFEFTF
jgi:hypothetical protein